MMATKKASPTTNPGATGRRAASAAQNLNNSLKAAAGEPVFPYPRDLPDKHKEIWRDTVNTKTEDYWSLGDVPLLKMYCRCAWDIDELTRDIEAEGQVIMNAKGNPVVNPKVVARGFNEGRLMSLCTKLRLQPSSRMDTKGEDSQLKKQGKSQRAAKVINSDMDGLLAGGGDESHDSYGMSPMQ